MSDQLLSEADRLYRLGRSAEAASLCQKILRSNPRHFGALYTLSKICLEAHQFEQAHYLLEEALKLDPAFADGHCIHGIALCHLGQFAEALASFDKAVSLRSDFVDAICNRSMLLLRMGDFEQALSGFDRVLALDPNHAVTWNNRGNALLSAKCYLDALLSYDRALSIWPDFGEAKINRANTLKEVAQSTAAETFADILCGRAEELMERQLYKEALACFDDALAVKAEFAAALSGREQARGTIARENRTSR
jgi:tetratricopeptide (TPR) repeat protein